MISSAIVQLKRINYTTDVDNTPDVYTKTEVDGIESGLQTDIDSKVPNTRTIAGKPLTSDVTLVKADVGLSNVDNTSDSSKPISTAQQLGLDAKTDQVDYVDGIGIDVTAWKSELLLNNVNNTTDSAKPISTATQTALDTKVPTTRTVAGKPLSANVLLVKADVGLDNVDNTSDTNKPVSTAQQSALDAKVPTSRTINGFSLVGNVILDKDDVGLGNVDNTSDAAKPVSTVQQTALNLKTNQSDYADGVGIDPTGWKDELALENVDNTSDLNKPISTAQQLALDAKATTTYVDSQIGTRVPTTRTVNGQDLSTDVVLDKNDINLGNVDNTTDLLKPISTATQTALDLKADWDVAMLVNNGTSNLTSTTSLVTIAWNTGGKGGWASNEYTFPSAGSMYSIECSMQGSFVNGTIIEVQLYRITSSSWITISAITTPIAFTTIPFKFGGVNSDNFSKVRLQWRTLGGSPSIIYKNTSGFSFFEITKTGTS